MPSRGRSLPRHSGNAMSDCERFEIAIDQRHRGALADDDVRALDAHLATCASCRAYEESVRSMQVGLDALAVEARRAVDWARIERGIHDAVRTRMRKLAFGVAIGIAAVALSTWGFAPPGERAAFAAEVGALVGAIVLFQGLRAVREARGVLGVARGDELIARHRAMLEKQVRVIRIFRFIALAVVVWLAVSAIRAAEARHVVVYSALACIVVGTWVHTLLVGYPRLLRQLAELGAKRDR